MHCYSPEMVKLKKIGFEQGVAINCLSTETTHRENHWTVNSCQRQIVLDVRDRKPNFENFEKYTTYDTAFL